MKRLRTLTGSDGDDPRLIGIRLDLDDSDSIETAARQYLTSLAPRMVLCTTQASLGSAPLRRCP